MIVARRLSGAAGTYEDGLTQVSSPNDPEAVYFYRSLKPEDHLLLDLRDFLYEGSWEDMELDLKNRLAGKPYVYKLINKIEDDLTRIHRMEGFEKRNSLNLRDVANAFEQTTREKS